SNSGVLGVLGGAPVGYSALGVDGSVYDFAGGAWAALPASGTPTAGQVRALAPYAAAGPLANQQYAAVPAAVFASPGVWLATFQLTAQSLAYVLDQQLALSFTGNDYFNWGGRDEKWLTGAAGWYFITPDGGLYRWDGSGTASGTLVGTPGTYYYDDPARLYNAVPDGTVASQLDDYPCVSWPSNSGVLSVLSA